MDKDRYSVYSSDPHHIARYFHQGSSATATESAYSLDLCPPPEFSFPSSFSRRTLLLSDAVQEFRLSLLGTVSKNTMKFYMNGVNTFIEFHGDIHLRSDVVSGLVTEWRLWLETRKSHTTGAPIAERTKIGYVKGIKRFLKFLQSKGFQFDASPPCLRTREPRDNNIKAISEENYGKILDIAKQSGPQAHLFVLLLADTGARLNEIASIKLTELTFLHDAEQGIVRVKGKGSKWRSVIFNPRTYRVLNSWLLFSRKGSGDYLFPGRRKGTHVHAHTFRTHLYKMASQAGCVGIVNPHSFRHRFAKIYLQRGGDIESLSRALGHANISITIRYYLQWTQGELAQIHLAIDPSAPTES